MRPQLQRQAVYRGNFKFHQITVPMIDLNADRTDGFLFASPPSVK